MFDKRLLGSDFIGAGSTIGTSPLHGRLTIFHGYMLGIFDVLFRFAFYAIH